MEKSQELYEALQKLESERDGIEKKWMMFNNSPELRALVEELIFRERTGPVEEIHRLQGELSERLKARDKEKEGYLVKWKAFQKELQTLTAPIILDSVREISDEMGRIKKKYISEIVSKKYSGLHKTTFLKIKSNGEAIKEAEKLAKEGTTQIQAMYFSSIPMIEETTKILIKKIRAIDVSRTTEKEVDEVIYFKGSKAPEGITPGVIYSGPLSGLPT